MNVLFVCLGNICRSPLAWGIMRHKIRQRKLVACTESAGFESYHVGQQADPRSIDIASQNGISLEGHVARQFRIEDFDRFDRIYVMDNTNYHDVLSLARNADDISKVDYIMNVLDEGSNNVVPDPYYGGDGGFARVYEMLDRACEIISDDIEKE